MKALTILQPWASLIAIGAKKIETRSWPTKYRGPIAIHAGKEMWHLTLMQGNQLLQDAVIRAFGGEPNRARGSAQGGNFNLPYGAVIAIAEIVDCKPTEGFIFGGTQRDISEDELLFGDFTPGRYAWILDNIRRIEPVPARGMQRIWNWGVQPWAW